MDNTPVQERGKKPHFKSNEALADKPAKHGRCRTPDGRPQYKSYQTRSPILEVKSSFTFGPCLPSGEDGARTSPSVSSSNDADQLCKTMAYGRSRRMSKSLPELRDVQFVSVLPDLEEEESDISDFGSEQIVPEKPTRVPWHRKLDFLWCSICHALGLANFWRFPYYCYSNGGGSFLVIYLIFLAVCSVPFLCMELAVGQMTQSGPISAFGQLCPLMKGIGVASMMLSFWLTAYYSVLASWALYYTFNSFYSPPRWTHCSNTWNTDTCEENVHTVATSAYSPYEAGNDSMASNTWLKTNTSYSNITNELSYNVTHPAVEFLNEKMLHKSKDIADLGHLRFELVASVLFVWILTYFALRKTDFFRGTTIYVLTVASYLLLFSIFLRTVALDGAKNGLHYLFKPQWDKMLNPRVMLYALAQAFHSLGVVLGPSILMGSCHKRHNNLLRDTIILTTVTLITVLMVGSVVFGTIGHLAKRLQKPFWSVVSDDPSNVFLLYSIIIGLMPLPSCWGVLFFLVVLFLGLDSQIKLMATLVSALKEAYTFFIKQRFQGHSMFLVVICGFCFVATIPYLTRAGIFFFQLADHYIAVLATIVVALLEVGTLGWLYGAADLSSCIQQMTGKTPSSLYRLSWKVLTPVTIVAVLGYGVIEMRGDVIKQGYDYPQWAHIVGWLSFSLTLCWIPLLAFAAYRKVPKAHVFVRMKTTIQPRLRTHSESMWDQKPVIILNGSTVTASEFPDYKVPDLPPVTDAVQTYVDKHSRINETGL